MLLRPKPKDVDPRERSVWGDLLSFGMVFPIAIVLGFFLGRMIGGFFGYPEAGKWIGLVWGIATGFRELYKVNAKLNRLEEAQKKDAPPPKDGPHDDAP
jgi:hypothetical protein